MWTCGLRSLGRKGRKEQGSERGEQAPQEEPVSKTQPANRESHVPPAQPAPNASTQPLHDGVQVLQRVHLQQGCDLLFVSSDFLEPRIAALLHDTTMGCKDSEFLHCLLGSPEKAQAAISAVLNGVPYKTVLEPSDRGALMQGGCRNADPQQQPSGHALPTVLATQRSARANLAVNAIPCALQLQQCLGQTGQQQLAEEADTAGAAGGASVTGDTGGAGAARVSGAAGAGRDAWDARDASAAGAAWGSAGITSADSALQLQQLQREPSPKLQVVNSMPLSDEFLTSGTHSSTAPVPRGPTLAPSIGSAHTQHAGSSKTTAKSAPGSSSSGDLSRPLAGTTPLAHQSSASSESSSRKGKIAECMANTQADGRQESHSLLPTSSSRAPPLRLSESAAAPAAAVHQASLPGEGCNVGAGAADRMHRASSLKALQLSDAALRGMCYPQSQRSCERTKIVLESFSRAASEELSRAASAELSCEGVSSGDMVAESWRKAKSRTVAGIYPARSCEAPLNACEAPLNTCEANQQACIGGGDVEGMQRGLEQQQQQQPLTHACDEAADVWLSSLTESKASQPCLASSGLQQKEKSTCRRGNPDPAPSIHAPKAFFEVSFNPLKSEPGRHPLAMMSITDVSESQEAQAALMALTEGQFLLLSSLLPQHAIESLARHSCTPTAPVDMHSLAGSHHHVTLLFMDIVGFTSMAKMVEPQSVMHLLSRLFSIFDELTDRYKIHKVETAGDCYIVSAGVLSAEAPNGFHSTLETHDHAASARHVMEFAKAVLHESAKVLMPHVDAPVEVRIGINTGDVMSGILGSKLPKFSLFGDSMNTASRMESNGKPGRIQVSETTRALLPEYAWEETTIMVKGKGAMKAYMWDSSKNEGWNQAALPRRSPGTSPMPEVQPCVSNNSGEQPQCFPRSTPLTYFPEQHTSSGQSNLLLALRAVEALVAIN